MSWDVYLKRNGEPVAVERHEDGGTYALGGTTEAWLNVTYNYGGLFREAWPDPLEGPNALAQMLDGKTGAETLPKLEAAIVNLVEIAGGITPMVLEESSYWDATPRNATLALLRLAVWANDHPDAVWTVH